MMPAFQSISSVRRCLLLLTLFGVGVLATSQGLSAQSCSSGPDLDAATKTAIDNAGTQILNMSKNGDVAGMRANAIPAITGDFGSIEQAVVTNKQYLADGQSAVTGTYL